MKNTYKIILLVSLAILQMKCGAQEISSNSESPACHLCMLEDSINSANQKIALAKASGKSQNICDSLIQVKTALTKNQKNLYSQYGKEKKEAFLDCMEQQQLLKPSEEQISNIEIYSLYTNCLALPRLSFDKEKSQATIDNNGNYHIKQNGLEKTLNQNEFDKYWKEKEKKHNALLSYINDKNYKLLEQITSLKYKNISSEKLWCINTLSQIQYNDNHSICDQLNNDEKLLNLIDSYSLY